MFKTLDSILFAGVNSNVYKYKFRKGGFLFKIIKSGSVCRIERSSADCYPHKPPFIQVWTLHYRVVDLYIRVYLCLFECFTRFCKRIRMHTLGRQQTKARSHAAHWLTLHAISGSLLLSGSQTEINLFTRISLCVNAHLITTVDVGAARLSGSF